MRKGLFDLHNYDRRRLLAVDSKVALKRRIGADLSASVDAVNLVRAGHEEDQADAGVLDKILKAIDPVVAAAVGNKKRPTVIRNFYEAWLVALWRAVEALVAASGKNLKRRGGDKGATGVVDMVEFQFEDSFRRFCVMRGEVLDARYESPFEIGHRAAPSTCNEESVPLAKVCVSHALQTRPA